MQGKESLTKKDQKCWVSSKWNKLWPAVITKNPYENLEEKKVLRKRTRKNCHFSGTFSPELTPPPLYKLRQSPKLLRSLRLL